MVDLHRKPYNDYQRGSSSLSALSGCLFTRSIPRVQNEYLAQRPAELRQGVVLEEFELRLRGFQNGLRLRYVIRRYIHWTS
jgi:hypothetical protein